MNHANLAFKLRPRNAYEAADLGMKLARQWWWPLFCLWLGAAVPVLILLLLITQNVYIVMIVIWWLKPLYERPLLYYLSRAVFQEVPTISDAWKKTPKLAWQQWIATLTWRRLSPSRSFDAPVVVLEGLKSKQRARRLSVLHRDKAGSVALWLTVIGIHIESIFYIGIMALIWALIPENVQFEWEVFFEANWIGLACSVISMALIAPFYVAAGFGLYLNRRVILEGWDLELVFKSMEAKHQATTFSKPHQSSVMMSLAALVFCLSAVFTSIISPEVKASGNDSFSIQVDDKSNQAASQQVSSTSNLTLGKSKNDINDILNSEDIKLTEKAKLPKFLVDWLESDSEVDDSSEPWNFALSEFLASIFQFMIWAAGIGLVLYALYYFRDSILGFSGITFNRRKRRDIPSHVLNLDIRETSLPKEISVAALALWREGKQRQAMALLYRASLSRLVHRHDLLINKGSTEGDCLRYVQSMKQPSLYTYFEQLTLSWQSLAYAHQLPNQELFERLCNNWSSIFDPKVEEHSDGTS